jgi:hypothetical protein
VRRLVVEIRAARAIVAMRPRPNERFGDRLDDAGTGHLHDGLAEQHRTVPRGTPTTGLLHQQALLFPQPREQRRRGEASPHPRCSSDHVAKPTEKRSGLDARHRHPQRSLIAFDCAVRKDFYVHATEHLANDAGSAAEFGKHDTDIVHRLSLADGQALQILHIIRGSSSPLATFAKVGRKI